jgi:hypothetical protein
LNGSQSLTTVTLLNTNMDVVLQSELAGCDGLIKRSGAGVNERRTPPEPDEVSSPVSAKGSIFWRFWIAELAISK